MRIDQFNEVVEQQQQHCVAVLDRKGDEYAPGNDRLAHFKDSGLEQDISAKQALWGMFNKHLVSLKNMCKGGNHPVELWSEKITDSINYLLLLRALVEEDADCENNT